MSSIPTAQQHRALLNDCWHLIRQLPSSGVRNRGGHPYYPIRVQRKLRELEDDHTGLLEYVRGMARRGSEGLDAIVKYNRLDLALENLILDESKVYAPLFTAADRAAAGDKFAGWTRQRAELDREREEELAEAQRRARAAAEARRTSIEKLRLERRRSGSNLFPELDAGLRSRRGTG